MKKIYKVLPLFLTLLFTQNVLAECTDTNLVDLSKKAVNIKMIYEVEEQVIKNDGTVICDSEDGEENTDCDLTYNYYKMSILNITDDFVVKVSNNLTGDVYEFDSSKVDSNGIVSFDWKNIMKITTFTMEIYGSSNSACMDEKLTTKYLTTPRKNKYADSVLCMNNSDYYLCEEYVTYDEMDAGEFSSAMNSYIENQEETEKKSTNEKTFWNNILDFLDEYKIYFIAGGVLIVVSVGIIIFVRKRRSL